MLFVFFFGAQSADAAFLYLEPNTGSVDEGEDFTVTLMIDTEGEQPTTSDGIIIYDDTKLQFIEAVQPSEEDRFFPRFFLNNRSNKIFIGSAIQPQGTAQSGIGELGKVSFKALTPGATTIAIQCEQGKTTDSNITLKKNQRVTDILDCSRVEDAQFTIGGIGGPEPTESPEPTGSEPTPTTVPNTTPTPTSAEPTATPSATLTPTPEPTPSALPETAGNIDITQFTIGAGIIMTLIGIVAIKIVL